MKAPKVPHGGCEPPTLAPATAVPQPAVGEHAVSEPLPAARPFPGGGWPLVGAGCMESSQRTHKQQSEIQTRRTRLARLGWGASFPPSGLVGAHDHSLPGAKRMPWIASGAVGGAHVPGPVPPADTAPTAKPRVGAAHAEEAPPAAWRNGAARVRSASVSLNAIVRPAFGPRQLPRSVASKGKSFTYTAPSETSPRKELNSARPTGTTPAPVAQREPCGLWAAARDLPARDLPQDPRNHRGARFRRRWPAG
eukprot:gene10817-biopygen1787